jgi:alpha-glucosidase
MAGGDYWNTNYPQPTFLTSRWLAVHCMQRRATGARFHRSGSGTGSRSGPIRTAFELFAADGPQAAGHGQLSARFGRQPPLARLGDWRGDCRPEGRQRAALNGWSSFIEAGTAVSGLWCEDWAGIRETSFGRRLFWDWRRDRQRLSRSARSRLPSCRRGASAFWPMPTPICAVDGILYEEARKVGISACGKISDDPYLVDFGEFDCGVLDFTRAETRDWFAEKVLGREMLDIGIVGLDG